MQPRTLAWVLFWILGLIWGSSFLLIRVGVGEMSPSQVVFIRTVIAAVGLNTVLLVQGRRLPTSPAVLRAFFVIGLGNAAIPYMLLGLGEQTVESNVASILQSTTSMFALVFAHFILPDERITPRKLIGLVLGFTGVVVLASRSGTEGVENALIGQVSVVGASLFYAFFTVYSRTLIRERIEPLVLSAGTFIFAALGGLVFMLLEPVLGGRAPADLTTVSSGSLVAVLTLGALNTFVAYLFYYFIVQQLGAFRGTMVTYIVPLVGVTLGWLVLQEAVDIRLLVGGALIFAGIASINLRLSWLRLRPAA